MVPMRAKVSKNAAVSVGRNETSIVILESSCYERLLTPAAAKFAPASANSRPSR